jgi:hypothetical protein
MRKKLFVTPIILLLSLSVFNINIAQGATRPRVDWAVLISGTNVFPQIPGPDEYTREPLRNCYYMLHILSNDWGVPRDHIKFLHIRPDYDEWHPGIISPKRNNTVVPQGTIDANCTIDDVDSTINDWLKPNCKSTDNALIFITTHGGGWKPGEYLEDTGGRIDTSGDEEIEHGDVGVDECLKFEDFKAKLRLQEGWPGLEYSHSEIDQVKLYALDSYGNRLPCPLTKATYNNYNLGPTLMMSDDIKLGIYLLETVDLEFIVPYQNIQGFAFVIEGCNMLKY